MWVGFKWFLNNAISLDQAVNSLSGGDPDETVSSRLGKIQRKHGGTVPWTRPLAKFLVWYLNRLQRNHCLRSIEEDEGTRAILARLERLEGENVRLCEGGGVKKREA